MATWNVELARRGPALLLRDILEGEPQVEAAVDVIAALDADVLLLTGIDWDYENRALDALAERLAEAGAPYPHRFAGPPNAGVPTGLDLDGDGRPGRPRDAQGYGEFTGQGGMALLSRLPIDREAIRDFTPLLWRYLPGATLPEASGTPFPSAEAQAVQRLSSVAHWDVPVILPEGERLHLWAWYATPPVFDGPEDRNGLRNADEAALWLRYLDGSLPGAAAPFVILGDANLDPVDGDGRPEALRALLDHPRVQDVRPSSEGGTAAALSDGGVNANHRGDPRLDTADWDDGPGDPGNLRVDYVLPSADLRVADAGVFWPPPENPDAALFGGEAPLFRHRPVWVDLRL